ncbi:MAG: mannose-6-phosphate isomerase-like protein (cupin superfamily) [Gammaproteobacteria bacterium]|jgi:mannose-6-phosphate isomerase-like protein (cupin superfamily)
MRKLFIILLFITSTQFVTAEQYVEINKLSPEVEYDNIHVYKMDTDKNKSTFIIWIKKEVKAHKHEFHTETLLVLEGAGDMHVGDESYMIKVGDYINVPENTPHSVVVTSDVPLKVISVQAPEFLGKDRVFVD